MLFIYSQSVAAGAIFDPCDGWQNQYVDSNAVMKLNDRATAVGLVRSVQATNRTLFQEAPVTAGGVAGTTPTDFSAPPMIEKVRKGERLSIRYRNPTGGAITVDGVIDLTPMGGKR